jgi:hypothetical protein
MVLKRHLFPILNSMLAEIELGIEASHKQVRGTQSLKQLLKGIDFLTPMLQIKELASDDVISFLIEKSHLSKVKFRTPRTETLYFWRSINEYELMPVLRPKGYYTHLSAMYFHGLLNHEPNNIYFNHEQPARPKSLANLEQARIDNAFQKKQRLTTSRTIYNGKEYWLLNGKQTNNYDVILIKTYNGTEIPVTDLERTLIDITVRPAYAGGVNLVLNAYRLAQPKVSIDKLKAALHSLNHVYPYSQSVGFYLEMAGNYANKAVRDFSNFDRFKYDFYLDYEMKEPLYSKKWRLYYPRDLK